MPLPSAGNPISFSQVNEELGNSAEAKIDLKSASEGLGEDVAPYGLDELQGLSFGRILQSIGYLDYDAQEGDPSVTEDTAAPYVDGQLDLAAGAENIDADITATAENYYNSDGGFSNGDILYLNNTGLTFADFPSTGADGLEQDGYLVNKTSNKVFFYTRSTSAVSNVISRTPEIPTKPTLVADSSTQITVTIPTTNTQVTKTFKIQRSIDGASFSDLATITPSAKGNFANTSVNTTYVDSSGLSAGDVVKYQVRGQNDFANSDFSQESNTITTPGTTTWTNNTSSIAIQVDTAKSGQQDTYVRPTTVGDAASIIVNNHSGNTSISVTQATYFPGSGELQIAVSLIDDPGAAGTDNSGTGWDTSHTNIDNDIGATIYYRIRHRDTSNNTETDPVNQTETITFTNNGVSETVSVPYRIQQNS